jgi:hypothetical protein
MCEVGFGEDNLVGAEGVGFDRVAANFEEILVDFLDNLGACEVEDFRNIFVAEPVALQVEIPLLQIGTHRAVENDDALPDHIEKRRT